MTKFTTTWTIEQDGIAQFLLSQGKYTREVAAVLGVTRNAVIGRMYRLGKGVSHLNGVKPGPWQGVKAKPAEVIMPALKSNPCTILYLTPDRCHWPLWGDKHIGEKLYCGAPVSGKTYCLTHWKKATAAPYSRSRRDPRSPLQTTKVPAKLPKSMIL